jgi:hypothetical protein
MAICCGAREAHCTQECSIEAHAFGNKKYAIPKPKDSVQTSFQIVHVSGYKKNTNIERQREPAAGAHIFEMSVGESDTAWKSHEQALQ